MEPNAAGAQWSFWFGIAASIAQVASTIVLVLVLLWTRKYAISTEKSIMLLAKANQFHAFNVLIQEGRQFKTVRDSLESKPIPTYDALKQRYGGIARIKTSDEMAELLRLGGYYDYVGTLVKHGFVDFELVFDMLPMPMSLWESVGPVVQGFRRDWVPDFWNNWEYLVGLYKERRLAS